MSSSIIVLADRVKELSHSTGTGNLRVEGAVAGFSSFGDRYSYTDAVFYAVTDGTDYEVGSGQYILDGANNAITRFPFHSSNSDTLVNFSAGVKEVYVTYPGKYAVFSGSGVDSTHPDVSGLAFWGSSQSLEYNSDIVWDNNGSKLGILTSSPQYALHIGGDDSQSSINVSGIIVGDSGIMFSGGVNTPGRQVEPFMKNELNSDTGTDAVFELSGVVNQGFTFQKQVEGSVFSGPPSGCAGPGCTPAYPTFRSLTSNDLPLLLIKVYATVPAAISALPPSAETSGAMAFGGTHLMVCDGNVWRSGSFV